MSEAAKRLIPLFNRVLIKKAEPVTHSRAGIFIPENARSRVLKGVVVAVGPGTKNPKGENVPCCIKAGDNVLLPDYGGTKVQYDAKQDYFLYRESDILAKIDE